MFIRKYPFCGLVKTIVASAIVYNLLQAEKPKICLKKEKIKERSVDMTFLTICSAWKAAFMCFSLLGIHDSIV